MEEEEGEIRLSVGGRDSLGMTLRDSSEEYSFLKEIAAQNQLDLTQYTMKVNNELAKFEDECIRETININPNIGKMYHQLTDTDNILSNILYIYIYIYS